MTITVTRKDDMVTINLCNEATGADENTNLTAEDARILAAKTMEALVL